MCLRVSSEDSNLEFSIAWNKCGARVVSNRGVARLDTLDRRDDRTTVIVGLCGRVVNEGLYEEVHDLVFETRWNHINLHAFIDEAHDKGALDDSLRQGESALASNLHWHDNAVQGLITGQDSEISSVGVPSGEDIDIVRFPSASGQDESVQCALVGAEVVGLRDGQFVSVHLSWRPEVVHYREVV